VQLGALFASTKTLTEQPDRVARFLRAYGKAVRDYHDAFIGPDEKRKNGPAAPELLAIIAQHLGQTTALVESALPYIDAKMRLDVKDIQHQLDWYKSEGMLKGEISADEVIDKGHVVPLP
jgi:NitT/TauT family transport system substrate-binding protein